VAQLGLGDCAAACVGITLAYHRRYVSLQDLREATGTGRDGTDAGGILAAARRYGLTARAVKAGIGDLACLPAGSILHWDFDHFVVFEKVARKGVVVVDPAIGRRTVTAPAFGKSYTGVAIILDPGPDFGRGGKARPRPYRYLRPILGQAVVARRVVVLSVVLQLLALAIPLFTAVVVGRIVPQGDRHLLVILTGAMAAVAGYYFLVSLVRARLLLHLRTYLDRQLTTGFVRHLADLPYGFFLGRSAGDLMMRMQSNATVREILTAASLSVILDGGLATVYLVLLLVISPPLGIVVLGLGAAQVTVTILARPKNQRLMMESLQAGARSDSYAYQLLAGIEDLKAAGAEDRAVAHWSGLFATEIETALGRGRLSALVESVTAALRLASPLALLAVGAALVLRGQLSLGTMLGLTMLGAGFLEPLALLVTTGLGLQLLGSYMARINDVLDTPKEQQGRAVRPAGRLSGHIQAERVSFRYSALAPLAVDGVSVQIRPGQLVAIVGRSGSGKSTLARLLLGLYEPEAGSVRYDGTDLRELEARSVRRQLGIVTQGSYVFGSSVRDNIALSAPGLPQDDVVRAARLACIDQDIEAMTSGYGTMLVEGGASLSGGQRQRLALARALAHRPSILLLDEATSALDAVTEAAVYRNLASLGSTSIVIAHRLSTISRADTIVVMDGGKVIEQGTHHELLARGGLYTKLFSGQVQPADLTARLKLRNRTPLETLGDRYDGAPDGMRPDAAAAASTEGGGAARSSTPNGVTADGSTANGRTANRSTAANGTASRRAPEAAETVADPVGVPFWDWALSGEPIQADSTAHHFPPDGPADKAAVSAGSGIRPEPVATPVASAHDQPQRQVLGQHLGNLAHLSATPRMRTWQWRAIIAIVVGAGFTIWISWQLGLTLAVLAAIADTVYRSRASYAGPGEAQMTGAQRRTRRQLGKLERAGYRAMHLSPIPDSEDQIDHLVVGPAGVFSIGSEAWDRRMPVRTSNHRQLWHGPVSQKERLEHARWESERAAELISRALGGPVSVRPAMAVYGPKILGKVATVRDVDVFNGPQLRKYLRRQARQARRRGDSPLSASEIERIDQAAHVACSGSELSSR
jgi:ATP-binding cassette, subfamily B, bacterial